MMKIEKKFGSGSLTFFLKGDLDEISSPVFEKEIEESVTEDIENIFFDLSRTDYISSIGIRVLMIAYKKALKSGKRIIIENMSVKAREVLDVVGILPLFACSGDGRDSRCP